MVAMGGLAALSLVACKDRGKSQAATALPEVESRPVPSLVATEASAASVVLVASAVPTASPTSGRAAECTMLNERINLYVEKLEKLTRSQQGREATGADLRSLAETMDQAAAELATVKTTLPELTQYSRQYQDMAKAIAKAARDVAVALDAEDVAKAGSSSEALEKAEQPEEGLVEAINKFCAGP
jgi:hypothetical protein